MLKTPKIYTKLSGFSAGMRGFAQLWSSPDQLLEVTAYGFSERYRRFYWREIEAVLVRRTAVRLIWNLISGVLAGLLAASGFALRSLYYKQDGNAPAQVMIVILMGICGLLAAICLLILIVNTLLGPRCVCVIKMPAGVERLGAPTRLRAAARVLEKIAPLIEIAQTEPAPPQQ